MTAIRIVRRRYRLMVNEPGQPPVDWVRIIDGDVVPIRTRREARRRRREFLRTHPECTARIKRGEGGQ